VNELSKNYQLKEKGKPVVEDGAKSAAALLEAKRVRAAARKSGTSAQSSPT